MSLKIRGNLSNLSIQPGRGIEEEWDGLLRGELVVVGDRAYLANCPQIGDPHPDNSGARCYHRSIVREKLNKIRCTASYIGITQDPTKQIVEPIPALNREPIDTHPDFVSTIGGTSGSELNGAVFDEDTGQFICFPPDAENNLGGVESYMMPSMNFRISYWTYRLPSNRKIGTITGKPNYVLVPDGIANFLVGPTTYRQVGTLYQVSEEILGSGPLGWNELIYPE